MRNEFIDLPEFFLRIQTACAGQDTDLVARRVDVPRATVERWLDERYAPNPTLREKVLERLEKR
jgi:hypothetical protein